MNLQAKKLTRLLILLLSLLMLLSACGKKIVKAEPMERDEGSAGGDAKPGDQAGGTAGPLMWEVKAKNGDGKIYLFGSMHVGEADLYPLPAAIETAFEESEALAVEFDISVVENDFAMQMEMLDSMRLGDGQWIRDIMGDELYEKVKDFITENGGMYSELYDVYNLAFWSSLIDEIQLGKTSLSGDYGIDSHFLEAAHERGIEVIDIESFEFQLDMMNSFPQELQLVMIESSIDNADDYETDLRELYDAYRFGDEEKLTELSTLVIGDEIYEEYSKAEAELLLEQADIYNSMMLTDRNIGMAEAAIDYLESGMEVFYVVGAAHMVGEGGIVELLRDAGYEVEQVRY